MADPLLVQFHRNGGLMLRKQQGIVDYVTDALFDAGSVPLHQAFSDLCSATFCYLPR